MLLGEAKREAGSDGASPYPQLRPTCVNLLLIWVETLGRVLWPRWSEESSQTTLNLAPFRTELETWS
jgi:hypothetical protein